MIRKKERGIMKKQNKKHSRRVRNMLLSLVLTGILLGTATYAWFIGMRTVNVSSFDVEIATTEDLKLSLNGKDWSDTVTISGDDTSPFYYDTVSYTNNTNWWAGRGLVPVSAVGVIDATSSRLVMYEKASLTPSEGGFRLMASQVPNTTSAKEVDGYVAFDLFVRNYSGRAYYHALDAAALDEEAIYLSTDSEVTVSSSGVAGAGIENSVRVAFAQIGRVIGTTADEVAATDDAAHLKITGIDCSGDGASSTSVTGICRPSTIWEPNDLFHVDGAVDWYNTSCKLRTAGTGAYTSTVCPAMVLDSTIADGVSYEYYPTYAVNQVIDGHDVDVYDGAEYNGFTSPELTAVETFTDTMKDLTGIDRPAFFYLAPNSVTKVRVYVYIEGQDVDNYDFASVGKSISVQFGFTKQRFTEDDVNYNGPELKPAIALQGGASVSIAKGTYTSYALAAVGETLGFDPTDSRGDVIPVGDVSVTENVKWDKPGTYKVTYKVTDPYTSVSVTATRTIIITG